MNAPNAVDVDREAIAAELAQLEPPTEPAPEAAPESGAPGAAGAQTVDWSAVMAGSMQMLSTIVAPNWQLSDEEQGLIATQGAAVLEAFFPNVQLAEKWLVLCVFAISTGGIVMQRYDEETGAFKPLRKALPTNATPAPASPAGEGAAPAAAAAEPSQPPSPKSVTAASLASVPG